MIWILEANMLKVVCLDKGQILSNLGNFTYISENLTAQILLPIPQLMNTKDKEIKTFINFE